MFTMNDSDTPLTGLGKPSRKTVDDVKTRL